MCEDPARTFDGEPAESVAARRTTFAVVTFGCRVNQADSLAIEAGLQSRGWRPTPSETAEVVVVNTCSVTAAADQGVRQTIRRLARQNPDARLVVTGCYATRRPGEIEVLPNVAQVVPNAAKDGLASLLAEGDPTVTTAERFGDGDGACGGVLAPGTGGRTALTLRLQTGCEEGCSYCIIPETRGASRSLPLPEVLARLRSATSAGYKEVILTGVHLGSYGRDLCDGSSLEALVAHLADWPEDVLFRISSLEPMDCSPSIVARIAGSRRIAPHFHLPLQHGSDRILRAMGRPYTAGDYTDLVRGIRARMPHAAIGSDVIVGFPGESDADFDRMCALLVELPLTHLHVFPYSDRPGTRASAMRGKVDGAAIRERGQTIRRIARDMAGRFRDAQVGSTMRALTVDTGRAAVTPNYLKVTLDIERRRNEWIAVRIDGGEPLAATVVGSGLESTHFAL